MTNKEQSELLNRITIKPGMMGGKPTIRGMRFPVKDILEMLASGMTHEEIRDDFPYIEEDDIRASLYYAALKLSHPIIPSHAI
jgi:uncharacterized protein (DUF433 family)